MAADGRDSPHPVKVGARPGWSGPLLDLEMLLLLLREAAANRNLSLLISLGFFAGLDAQEARSLRWTDIDLTAGTLRPPVSINKRSGHERPSAWQRLAKLGGHPSPRAGPVLHPEGASLKVARPLSDRILGSQYV